MDIDFQIANSTFPVVLSVNVSQGGIPKLPLNKARVFTTGLEGDGHNHEKHYRLEQAVCLQDIEHLDALAAEGYPLEAGTTGENLTVKNVNVNGLPLGTVLEFTSGLAIQLAKIRKPCYVLDSIDPTLKENIIGRCGMYAKVIREGVVSQHDSITIVPPPSECVNP